MRLHREREREIAVMVDGLPCSDPGTCLALSAIYYLISLFIRSGGTIENAFMHADIQNTKLDRQLREPLDHRMSCRRYEHLQEWCRIGGASNPIRTSHSLLLAFSAAATALSL